MRKGGGEQGKMKKGQFKYLRGL